MTAGVGGDGAAGGPADVYVGEADAEGEGEEGRGDAPGEEGAPAALGAVGGEDGGAGGDAEALPHEGVDPEALDEGEEDGAGVDGREDEAHDVGVVAVEGEGAVRLNELDERGRDEEDMAAEGRPRAAAAHGAGDGQPEAADAAKQPVHPEAPEARAREPEVVSARGWSKVAVEEDGGVGDLHKGRRSDLPPFSVDQRMKGELRAAFQVGRYCKEPTVPSVRSSKVVQDTFFQRVNFFNRLEDRTIHGQPQRYPSDLLSVMILSVEEGESEELRFENGEFFPPRKFVKLWKM